MEKTLSMGAFTELDENEVMEVDGGGWRLILGFAGVCAVGVVAIGAIVATGVNYCNEKGANKVRNSEDPSRYYNYDQNGDGSNDCYRYTTYTWTGPQSNYVY